MQKATRMKRELEIMRTNPPPGISCFPRENSIDTLDASIMGAEGSPYESGIFRLEISIPERYPFEPPRLRFATPVYHPNIDASGRICLDLLRSPPAGSWRPTINIAGILTAIQLLMTQPNPDDPLMADIAEEFKFNRLEFNKKAEEWTKKYAVQQLEQTDAMKTTSSQSAEGKRRSTDELVLESKRLKT